MYRKNLDAAYLAAASTPGAANALVTATEQPWEQVANVVQVKSGFGASGCRVGTDSTTATVDAYAEWDAANKGQNASWATNKWTNSLVYGANVASGATCTSSATLASGALSNLTDGTTSSGNYYIGNAAGTITIDLGSDQTISRVTIYGCGGSPVWYHLTYISKIESSSDNSNWTDWSAVSGNTLCDPTGTSFDRSLGSLTHRYIRITFPYVFVGSGTFTTICAREIQVFGSTNSSTLNAVPTPNLVTGTQSFSPSTLKLYTTTAMLTELVNGEATVSFCKIIAGNVTDYGSQESLTTFRARPASEFANCTSLKIKVAPVGANTFGALTIDTASSSIITTKAGAVTITVDGSTVYQVQTDGDVVAADITADDITLTGSVDQDREATTVKSQTKSDNYTMTDADSGIVTYVDTDAKTITLPATAVNRTFTLMNAGADGAVALTISPNASDKIMGAGLTAADDKDIVNTKATAKKGDYVTLIGDGVDGWFVTAMKGTWARES